MNDYDTPQPTTLASLLNEHEYETGECGDGHHVPFETWIGCSCGVLYHHHVQHSGCDCAERGVFDLAQFAPQEHAQHVLAMAVRARLARSQGSTR